jgi:hypothetical protein
VPLPTLTCIDIEPCSCTHHRRFHCDACNKDTAAQKVPHFKCSIAAVSEQGTHFTLTTPLRDLLLASTLTGIPNLKDAIEKNKAATIAKLSAVSVSGTFTLSPSELIAAEVSASGSKVSNRMRTDHGRKR